MCEKNGRDSKSNAVRVQGNACVQISVRACVHPRVRACMRACVRLCVRACMSAHLFLKVVIYLSQTCAGFLLHLCELCIINYWGAIAAHTLVAVRWNVYQFSRRSQIVTHSLCVGIPLLLAIVALATKCNQATPATPFAYFRAPTLTKPNNTWPEYPLFWGPMGIVLILVVVCITLVLIPSIKVCNSRKKLADTFSTLKGKLHNWPHFLFTETSARELYSMDPKYAHCDVCACDVIDCLLEMDISVGFAIKTICNNKRYGCLCHVSSSTT